MYLAFVCVLTSGASYRLCSWCSFQMCASGSRAGWPWLSRVWCWSYNYKNAPTSIFFKTIMIIKIHTWVTFYCIQTVRTWPSQTVPSTFFWCPLSYKRTGSLVCLWDGSGRSHMTTAGHKQQSKTGAIWHWFYISHGKNKIKTSETNVPQLVVNKHNPCQTT